MVSGWATFTVSITKFENVSHSARYFYKKIYSLPCMIPYLVSLNENFIYICRPLRKKFSREKSLYVFCHNTFFYVKDSFSILFCDTILTNNSVHSNFNVWGNCIQIKESKTTSRFYDDGGKCVWELRASELWAKSNEAESSICRYFFDLVRGFEIL